MDYFSNFFALIDFKILLVLALLVCIILFIVEGYKFFKYKMKSDLMDFSFLGAVGLGSFIVFDDLFLSGLAVIFVLMIIGTYELRESPVWVRLMASFTITYGFLLFGLILEKAVHQFISGKLLPSHQISGFFYYTMMWVLLISAFAFFGKRFILVSRFLSPQYVYLFVYGAVYLIIFTTRIVPIQYRYLALFGANIFIYCISGWLLTFLFQIKPLNDERSLRLVKEIEKKIDTPIRTVGIVQAPILNAFAYGPWFDQRFAFIVKDINDFTDEELLGITAHEVSHLKGKHTFWLLWVGFVDLFLRVLFGIPLNTLDFTFGVSGRWDYFSYYIVNILFFACALIFVRIMEANADKRSKEIGYGHELAEALFTLEGFYRGIAGELGLNAQLLTDSSRTEAEEKRFAGEAAIDLHNRLIKPGRSGMIMNLIVSHPPTTFRIAAMVSDKFSSLRLALLPIMLLIPGIRSRNIKYLSTTDEEFSKLLTECYNKRFNSLESYASNSFTSASYNYYLNRQVLLRSKLENKKYYIGTMKSITLSDYIVDPISLVIQTEDGEQAVPSKNYWLQIYEPETQYIVKKKQIMTLKKLEVSDKGKFTFYYEKDSRIFKMRYLGITLRDFSIENSFILQSRGKYEALTLISINDMSVPLNNIEKTSFFPKAKLNFVTFNPGKEMLLKSNNLKISVSPLVLFLYKRFETENISLIKFLIKSKVKLTMYSSKDPDIGIPCEFTNVTEDNKIYYRSAGEKEESEMGIRQVDAIVLRNPFKLIQSTKEIGIFSKIANKIFSSRNKFTSF